MYGYSEKEALQMNVERLTPPNRKAEMKEFTRRLREGEAITSLETQRVTRDNRILDIWLTVTKLVDDTGKPIGIASTERDITERKRNEEELQKSEGKFRAIFDNASDGTFLVDLNARKFFICNAMCVNMLGYTQEEFSALDIADIHPREDMPFINEQIGKFSRGEEGLRSDIRFKRKDGSIFFTDLRPALLTIAERKYLLISFTDITERKQAEKALHASEERYRMLFEGAAEGILVADIESRQFKYSNPAICKMFGYTAEEMLQLGVSDIHPKEALDNVTAEFDAQASNKKIIFSEIPCLRKDGSIFYAIIATTPIIINGRKCNVGFFTDITERKKAEEKLRETRDYLENLLSFTNAPIIVWDSNFRITRFNVAFERLTSYSMHEVIGKHPEMFFPADKREASLALIRQTSTGSHLVSAEIPICCKDGGIRIVLWNSANIYTVDDQTLTATIAHGLDITERKQAEEERNKLQEELIQSHKMKSIGTLAGGIAHDFNNILGIILGYTSLLKRRRLDEEKHSEGITIINQAVQRGAALVRQILTFARKTDIEFEPFDLTDLIHELISMLRQTFPRIISFTENIEKYIPYLYADRTQIYQALLNLCVNARDAMPNGGSITIEAKKQSLELVQGRFAEANQNSYICISVTDTGEGMDEATRLRVFEPFFTTKEKGKGTGMGLSVVYGVVHAHNGFIDLESEVGRGTIFRLYFPIPVIGEQMVKSQQPPESYDIGGTETILIVEDEELLVELVRLMLESKGYKVFSTKDGREAIEIYRQHKEEIALVLTDMGLPEMTGADEFKMLKEIEPNVKVVFASGFFNPDIKSELLQAGARGFLQKPYEANEILKTIRIVLDQKGI
jgi:PAS domain S-box-containing protein